MYRPCARPAASLCSAAQPPAGPGSFPAHAAADRTARQKRLLCMYHDIRHQIQSCQCMGLWPSSTNVHGMSRVETAAACMQALRRQQDEPFTVPACSRSFEQILTTSWVPDDREADSIGRKSTGRNGSIPRPCPASGAAALHAARVITHMRDKALSNSTDSTSMPADQAHGELSFEIAERSQFGAQACSRCASNADPVVML